MEAQFFCVECRSEHAEPAEAILGYVVVCLDCALVREIVSFRIEELRIEPPLAA